MEGVLKLQILGGRMARPFFSRETRTRRRRDLVLDFAPHRLDDRAGATQAVRGRTTYAMSPTVARSLATCRRSAVAARARRPVWSALCSAVLCTVIASVASGRPRLEPILPLFDEMPRAYVAQRGSISLQQATAMALSRYRGRVVRAEPITQDDRIVYEIRILGEDGRVRTVRIDAQTGQFL
jgi:hypothetical protein